MGKTNLSRFGLLIQFCSASHLALLNRLHSTCLFYFKTWRATEDCLIMFLNKNVLETDSFLKNSLIILSNKTRVLLAA